MNPFERPDDYEGKTWSMKDIQKSPLYGEIMSGRQQGEEGIMRNASATGGLRSGNVQSNMYEYNTGLANRASLAAYQDQKQGFQSMAKLPSNSGNIANLMGGIGQTYGQGMIGSAQAEQASQQNNINNIMGLGRMALMGGF